MARVSIVCCLGILALCLVVPVSADKNWWDKWWGSLTGNWTMGTVPPENCPHNYTELNLCSRLIEIEHPCFHFVCCSGGGTKEEIAESESESESKSEEPIQDDTEGECPDSMCIETRQCSSYICITDCCEGYHKNADGTCHNTSSEVECHNGGTMMVDRHGFAFCACKPGFMGVDCAKPYCGICENGGSCVINDHRSMCQCPTGFTGKYCEIRTCSKPCYNGGRCISDGRHDMCNCTLPYVGRSCEVKHEDSSQCPVATHHYPSQQCHFYCNKDTDCYGDLYCCKDGCSLVCKRPKTKTCSINGKIFAVGDIYKPDSCSKCECTYDGTFTCKNITHCPQVMCKQGTRPVKKHEYCCPVCEEYPDDSDINLICPKYHVHLDLTRGQRSVTLNKINTGVLAFDERKRPLEVTFVPSYLKHCECDKSRTQAMAVAAHTEDRRGGKAKCRFMAYVHDREPPKFFSCPEDMVILEGDKAQWQTPRFMDNVGIARKACTPNLNGQNLRRGNYSIQYIVTDFDGNTAICNFTIYSIPRDTPSESLPEGLKQRQEKSVNVGLIVGPIMAAIGLFALILAMCLFMRMRRRGQNGGTQQAAPARQVYDNNIYHLPTDVSLTPPPYTLPYNPPAYSANGDMKEAEYATVAPPTYKESVGKKSSESFVNPNYAALGQKSEI